MASTCPGVTMMMMMMMVLLSRQQNQGQQKTGSPKPWNFTPGVECSSSKQNKQQETTDIPRDQAFHAVLCKGWSCFELQAPKFTSQLQAEMLHLCRRWGAAAAAAAKGCDIPDVGLWSPVQEVGRCGISRAASQAHRKGSGCGERISHSQGPDHKRGW